jgi:hypothetical protein
VAPSRRASDAQDDCEQLFLKCRPPLAAKTRVSASPEPETIPESESTSQLVESVDEVTVIEVRTFS